MRRTRPNSRRGMPGPRGLGFPAHGEEPKPVKLGLGPIVVQVGKVLCVRFGGRAKAPAATRGAHGSPASFRRGARPAGRNRTPGLKSAADALPLES